MRTGLLVTAMAGITAVTAAAGYGAGRLTLTDQATDLGASTPLVSVAIPVPSATPPPVLPDPDGPPLEAKQTFRGRTFRSVVEPPRTLHVDVPREWSEILSLSSDHLEVKFRVPDDRTYWLRIETVADPPADVQARDERRDELRRNGTRDLRIIDAPSGTVTSRVDGTQRRYEELDLSFTDDSRRRLFVLIRWVDGIEISVTGRERDVPGMKTVLDRATKSVWLAGE